MKYLLLALALTGCSSEVRCWYPVSITQSIGEPWFQLRGRTPFPTGDLYGPIFKTQAEMESYIANQNLAVCGRNAK